VQDKDKTLRSYTMMLGILAAGFFVLTFFMLGQRTIALLSLLYLGIFAISFLLNWYDRKNPARLLMLGTGLIMITSLAALTGKEANFQLIYIVEVCALFSFYRLREWQQIVGFMTVAAAALIFLEVTHYEYFGKSNLSQEAMSILNYTNLSFTVVLTVLLCFNMQLNNKRILSTVNREKLKSQSIIENTSDAIWLLDASLCTLSFNEACQQLFEKILGRSNEIGLGLDVLFAAHPKHKKWWEESLNKSLEGHAYSNELELFIDENKVHFNVAFNPVRSSNGIQGVSIFARDISARKKATAKLQEAAEMEKERNWMHSGVTQVTSQMLTHKTNQKVMLQTFINEIVDYLDGIKAALYLTNDTRTELQFKGGYAHATDQNPNQTLRFGEGLVGQVAQDQKTKELKGLSENYFEVKSALGKTQTAGVLIVPLVFNEELIGVLEIASLKAFTTIQKDFLQLTCQRAAGLIEQINKRNKAEQLLVETRELNARLQAQEEELRVNNEELTAKTQELMASEEELREQQEELMQTNAQIEAKSRELELQSDVLKTKNTELENTREILNEKAEELEATSKYKSEFLANMSHELRTPLNSIMILSKLLSENENKPISGKLLDYTKVIGKSGADLLQLINDILDISKIESRKLDIIMEEVSLGAFKEDMDALFNEVAKDKGIQFSVTLEKSLPEQIVSDKFRLAQIIKNLLSNALKFTPEQGSVSLNIYQPTSESPVSKQLEGVDLSQKIAFSVTDTGIGIPDDKKKLIFEAFSQMDGSINRKYGGTGLGLTISRQLASLLGGSVHLESEVDKGSTFSLVLPLSGNGDERIPSEADNTEKVLPNTSHKTEETKSAPKSLLIIEDDATLSKIIQRQALEQGFRCLTAQNGEEGLKQAKEQLPNAILLDIKLPGIDGWEVMKLLKDHPSTSHIPVHMMSGSRNKEKSLEAGAKNFLQKPFNVEELSSVFESISGTSLPAGHKVLIVKEGLDMEKVSGYFSQKQLDYITVAGLEHVIEQLVLEDIAALVFNYTGKDSSGHDLLTQIRSNPEWSHIQIISILDEGVNPDELKPFQSSGTKMIVKTEKSYERLLDETLLFFQGLDSAANPQKDSLANAAVNAPEAGNLEGKTILLVDDDPRNIYALEAALENSGANLLKAENGLEAVNLVKNRSDIDLVLMDIMMPEMDGYEAMGIIRNELKLTELPIIAVTAKAMSTDAAKCMEAGASDYLPKPLNTAKLLELMKVWLYTHKTVVDA